MLKIATKVMMVVEVIVVEVKMTEVIVVEVKMTEVKMVEVKMAEVMNLMKEAKDVKIFVIAVVEIGGAR